MYRRSFISFAALFIFWITVSGSIDIQHILVGVPIAAFTIWFWSDLGSLLPSLLNPKELLLFAQTIFILFGYIIKSNLNVARIILFSDIPSTSMFMELEPGIKTDWGRVLLSTFMTITPGTITIDFDPETDVFTVHAINRQTGIDLYYWTIITEIRNLERMVVKRKALEED